MVLRWLKRLSWLGLCALLVLGPARFAHGPQPAQAMDTSSSNASAVPQPSPAAVIITTACLVSLISSLFLRRHRAE